MHMRARTYVPDMPARARRGRPWPATSTYVHGAMARRRVVVTGLGLCCPLGTGTSNVWRKLLEGRSGVTKLPDEPRFQDIPARVAGVVPRGVGPEYFDEKDWVTPAQRKSMSLGGVYALCASTEALGDAQWEANSEDRAIKSGVAIGAGISDLDEIATAGSLLSRGQYRRISPYFVPRILTNLPAGHVSMRFGLQGPNHSVSTACTTGLHAIGDAFCMIARGAADLMVAGGTEACITPIAFAGFCRARALSTRFNAEPEKASRPFDSRRDGFVLGEGAGVLVLEELEHARGRGAAMYAEVLGYGMSGDAHHVTAPRGDGRGAQLSMMAALRDAGIQENQVGHINAHATSTPVGDAAEGRAIRHVFGAHARDLLVSAPKGAVGHLLGAAGSVEAVFAVLSVREGVVPPSLNLEVSDIEVELDYVRGRARKWAGPGRRIALTNSFGFGGTNASLCVGQLTDHC